MSTDTGLSREAVPAAFDVGASAYDRLVGANPGYHAHLRLSAQRMRLPDDGRALRLLDAGCGTGASTAALLSAGAGNLAILACGALWLAALAHLPVRTAIDLTVLPFLPGDALKIAAAAAMAVSIERLRRQGR